MIFELFLENITTVLVFLVAFFLVWSLLTRRPVLPPGPWPLPYLGNINIFMGDPRLALEKLREKYGDVYTVYAGNMPMVYIHDYKKVKEVLVTRGDDFLDRPLGIHIAKLSQGKGIIFSSGKSWQEQRRFAIQALREFGFGKPELQAKIHEEVEVLVNRISDMGGEPFDIQHLIHISVSNVICSVVFGKRFEHDDPQFKRYVRMLSENFKYGKLSMAFKIPFAKYMPGDPLNIRKISANMKDIQTFVRALIQEHKDRFDPDNVKDFIDAYLKEMGKRKERDHATTFSEEQLRVVIGDLFAAGTDTTATTIRWAILLLLKHPDVQARVRLEIDTVVGGRLPNLDDRQRLRFTEATIMEVLRYVGNAGGTRACVRDITFHGYEIPKGASVMPCFYCALNSDQMWEDAGSFNPSRFLDEAGELIQPEHFIPFSAGKRVCLAESLARMELYLFLAAILQRFELRLPEGVYQPDLTAVFGVTITPRPFTFIAKPRQ